MDLPREILLQLLELQQVDSTIDRLEARKRNLPEQAEIDKLESQISVLTERLAEHQVEVDDVIKRHNKMDTDVELISEKIKSEQEKLYAGDVTNPKELSALQAEVESLGKRKTALEDAELEVMEEREGAEKILKELQSGIKELEDSLSTAKAARDKASGSIDSELATQTEERERWSGKFDADTLSFYDEMRAKRGGIAIAALVSGTCQGCKMRLPVQEVEKIKAAPGISYCDECRRVLVIAE